jgi:O-antigen ligase
MGFLLLILLTGTLFVRPGEIFSALRGTEIFFYLFMPCFILAFDAMMGQLSARNLQTQPITVCVFLILLADVLSNLIHFNMDGITDHGMSSLKNVMYYLLLISLVNTPIRFRQLLFWVWFFCLLFIVLILLKHQGFIELSTREALDDSYISETGEIVEVKRMSGSGLFGDPNDLCMVIVTGVILNFYLMSDNLFPLPRLFHWASVLVFGYALQQTQSRGGFIAFMAACGMTLLARFGWKKATMATAAILPLVLVIFKGRLTTISTEEGTAHSRIQLWSDGLEYFKSSPLFGIGSGTYADLSGHVAHNAYVHAYAELGLLGGGAFLGAFFFAMWAVYHMGNIREKIADPNLRNAQPFMLALIAGLATLFMTISQTYYMSTYMIFGLVTAYLHVTNAPKLLGYRLDFNLIKRLSFATIAFLAALYIFVQKYK